MRNGKPIIAFAALVVASMLAASFPARAAPDKPATTFDTAAIEELTGPPATP